MSYAGIQETFVDQYEDVINVVAEWGAKYVDDMIKVLAPDGRPLGMEKLSEREEVQKYMQELRGQPEKWADWIREKVGMIKGSLAKSGLSEEQIMSVHPYDVVERFAIVYSARMENLVREYNNYDPFAPAGPPAESLPAILPRVTPSPSLPDANAHELAGVMENVPT